MNIININGSPNKNGNKKAIAEKMLKGKENNSRHLLSYNLLLRGSTRGK